MSRATTHKSSQVDYDGKHLITIHGNVQAANATTRFGHFTAPCDGKIRRLIYNITTVFTHATNNLSFGTMADIDSHLNEIDITDLAAGERDACTGVEGTEPLLDLDIVKGTVYAWGHVGGDTTGNLTTCVVIEPV